MSVFKAFYQLKGNFEMIAIIDYGMGNLRSVQAGLEYVGQKPFITDDPKKIMDAPAVVLPGVGAFADAIERLEKTTRVNNSFMGVSSVLLL